MGLGIFEAFLGYYQAVFKSEYRISGTFYNTNHLAGFLACLSVVLLSRIIFNKSFRTKIIPKLSFLLILLIALFLTRSRGGLLSLIGGIGLIIIFLKKARKRALLLLILCLILSVIIPNPIMHRIKEIRRADIYAYSRLSMWKSAIKMLKEHPLFGVGLGNFRYYSHRYAFPVNGAWARYAKVANYAHNEILHLWAETGTPGILFFIAAIIVILILLLKENRDCLLIDSYNKNSKYYEDKLPLFIGTITLLLHSMVDFVFHIPPIIFMLIILLAWIRKINIEKEDLKLFSTNLSGKGFRLITLVCLIIPIISGWIVIRQYMGDIEFRKAGGENLLKDIKHIKRAIKIDFGCAPYHNSLGGAYFKLFGTTGDFTYLQKGIIEAELAQRLNPEDYRFPLSLGQGYLSLYIISPDKKHLLDQAVKEFDKSLQLAPFHYQIYLGLGKALFYQKRLNDALLALNRAIELEPYSVLGHYWLGSTYKALGDQDVADHEYKKIKEILNMGLGKNIQNSYEMELIDSSLIKMEQKLKKES